MKIFVSYRREDSEDITGRLYDRLEARFGREALFIDVDHIPFGVDFRKHLSDAVGDCDVLLAMIGKQWLDSTQPRGPKRGQRRLDDPSDFVRIEIESALRRNIPVVPVLVGNAVMPVEDDLPPGLKDLAYRNAAQIGSGRDFRDQAERLIRGLEEMVAEGVQNLRKPIVEELGGRDEQPVAESADDDEIEDESVSSAQSDWKDEGSPESGAATEGAPVLPARVVHMHEATGVLADLTVPEGTAADASRIDVAFVLPPSETVLARISLDVSQGRDEPVRYLRLKGLKLGPEWWSAEQPVILRVYRSVSGDDPGRAWSSQGVRVETQRGIPVCGEDLGILVSERFRPVIPAGTRLPCVRKLRMKTSKDNQRVIRVTPAVVFRGAEPRVLPRLRVQIWALATAGVVSKEFTFRVDPDGRITVFARDPISGKAESEMLIVG